MPAIGGEMSGHSKWHTIKHKKAALDAKRGQQFTRLIKEITVAARIGGGDIEGNPRLRAAVSAAKGSNMPQDNIKRAIQKGTGELPGVSYEEVVYEGYAPGGVAVMVEAMTDNLNRTAAEIRSLFTKHGGNLGAPNCVAWMFERKGFFEVAKDAVSEDRLMEVALDAGADDVGEDDGTWEVTSPVENFQAVGQALEAASIPALTAELSRLPTNTVRISGRKAEQVMRFFELLEDHDDIQKVWGNFEVDESLGDQD